LTVTSFFDYGDGGILEDVGSVAFTGAEKDERVVVELMEIAFRVTGLRISSEGASKDPLEGSILLSPVVSEIRKDFVSHYF
jgi:hypothetical protein